MMMMMCGFSLQDIVAELHNLKSAIQETSVRVDNLTQTNPEADDDGKRKFNRYAVGFWFKLVLISNGCY